MKGTELGELIRDSFQATSLLLVFVIMLFDVKYGEVRDILQKELPYEYSKLKVYKAKLMQTKIVNIVILNLVYAIVFILFLPLFIEILLETVKNNALSELLVNEDITVGAFVLITLIVFGLLVWSIYLTCQLQNRIKVVNQKLTKSS